MQSPTKNRKNEWQKGEREKKGPYREDGRVMIEEFRRGARGRLKFGKR